MISDDEMLQTSFGGDATLERLPEQHDISDIIKSGIDFATKTGQNPKGYTFDDAEHAYVRVGDPHQGAAPSRTYIVLKNGAGVVEDHDVELIRDDGGEVVGREFIAFVEKGRPADE